MRKPARPGPAARAAGAPRAAAPGAFDGAAVERAIAELILALGLDPAGEAELARTPARVADFYREALSGLDPGRDPDLVTFPNEGRDDLVIVRDLPFHSLCVHHFAPFFGRALVAYVPAEKLVGISAPARLLETYSRRPQLQERLGGQVADHLERLLAPRGVAVVLEARHLCMEMRGVRRRGVVETRAVRGELADPRWADTLRLPPER
jgi:GTP cyclohydrolase I